MTGRRKTPRPPPPTPEKQPLSGAKAVGARPLRPSRVKSSDAPGAPPGRPPREIHPRRPAPRLREGEPTPDRSGSVPPRLEPADEDDDG